MSITPKRYHLFILLISLTAFISAYIVEYVMMIMACPLCIYQRFPYMLLFTLSVIGLAGGQRYYGSYALIFLLSILLAAYHSGVEQGIFELSAACKPLISLENIMSAEQFQDVLYSSKLGTCNKAAIIIAGYSMAQWNLFLNIALLLSIIIVKTMCKSDA